MSTNVRIPADVDRHDRLVGPFTARPLAILAGTALVFCLAWALTRNVVSPIVILAVAAPVGSLVAVLLLTTRDGLSADRLLVAAIRHRLRPRHWVRVPQGFFEAPTWLTARARRTGKSPIARPLTAHDVRLPESVSPSVSGGQIGIVDVGPDGLVAVAAAGTINLGLRTSQEQNSLVAQLGNWLHALRQPVQIVVRSVPLDLSTQIGRLQSAAEQMSEDLAATATDHAEHLGNLVASEVLLHRQVLLVWREPVPAVVNEPNGLKGPSPAQILAASVSRRRKPEPSEAARRAAETRLVRRIEEATELLAPLGVTVAALDCDQVRAVLEQACKPGSLVPPSAPTASHNAVITAETALVSSDIGDDSTQQDPTVPDAYDSSAGGFEPDSLTIGSRHLQVGSEWVTTLAVTRYPREVSAGWLAPLATHPGRIDLSVQIDPVNPVAAASRLRRQLARLEASRAHDLSHGRLTNPLVNVAAEDAAELSERIARGEGRLFRMGLYVTVHADSEEELADEVAAIRALAASLLLDTCVVTYRALQGWVSTLPLGLDLLGVQRTFDTAALAASFPFNSPQLPAANFETGNAPTGVLYGRDAAGGLLFWDRFATGIHNHNAVILGRSGSGKSYFVKSEILRSLHRGIENIVIDPENEYRALADLVGGTYIDLGSRNVVVNPFDLEVHTEPGGRWNAPPDALTRRKLFLHTVVQLLLGEQTPAQRAALDTAVTGAYATTGITDDPETWTRPAPTFSDLRGQLAESGSSVANDLAAALAPYTAGGAFGGLLDGHTTAVSDGGFVVFSLRELPDELKAIGTLLALDATWRTVANPANRRPRLVTVDEAWLLMRQPAGAEFLFKAAKSFRKHWAGLTVATQDCADVLGSELGKAIVANSATQILLRQAPQAIDEVGSAFGLSDGERQFLLSAGQGHGLLATGPHRAIFAAVASPGEHDVFTSDPAEIAANGNGRIDLSTPIAPSEKTGTNAENGDLDGDSETEWWAG